MIVVAPVLLVLLVSPLSPMVARPFDAAVHLPGPPALAVGIGRASASPSASTSRVWTNISSGTAPPGGGDAGMTWDPSIGGFVYFGGDGGAPGVSWGIFASTWVYRDSSGWTNVTGSSGPGPSARWGLEHQLIFDPNFGGDILFGGCSASSTALNDTWLYKAGVWTDISSGYRAPNGTLYAYATAPPPLMFAGMAFDVADNYTLLYGGSAGSPCANQGTSSETWELTPTGGWLELSPSTSPPALRGDSTAYDPAAQAVIMFGGRDLYGTLYSETWSYAHGVWTDLNLNPSPPASYLSYLTYDSHDGYLLAYGGCSAGGCVLANDQSWMLRGGTWTNLSGYAPVSRGTPGYWGAGGMEFDPVTNATLLQGGVYGTSPSTNPHTVATWQYDWSTPTALLVENRSAVDPGSSVTFTGSATGGSWSYTFGFDGLPSGCSPGNVASFRCTFSTGGSYAVTMNVADSMGVTANASVVLDVRSLASVSLAASAGHIQVGGTIYFNASAVNGTAPYTYTYSGLPTGCTSSNSPSLLCRPTGAGNFTVQVALTDSIGSKANASVKVSVVGNTPPSPSPNPGGSKANTTSNSGSLVPIEIGIAAVVGAVIGAVAVLLVRRRRPPAGAPPN